MLGFLIGVTIGVLVGAAVIGICECIKLAADIFDKEPGTTTVSYIKTDSGKFRDINWHPKIRQAMQGEGGNLVELRRRDGLITGVSVMSKNLSSDFDDCSGYMVNRNNRENAIAIR